MTNPKVTVVGAGNVGATLAQRIVMLAEAGDAAARLVSEAGGRPAMVPTLTGIPKWWSVVVSAIRGQERLRSYPLSAAS